MIEKNIKNTVNKINETLTEDYIKNLSDEQLDELTELIKEIHEKLGSN